MNRSPVWNRHAMWYVVSWPAGPPDELHAYHTLVRFAVSRAVVVDHDRNPVGVATLPDLVRGHVQG